MSSPTNPPALAAKAVWSARVVGWTTLLMGFFSGFVIAALNWARMGDKQKAALHLLAAVGAAGLYTLVLKNYIGVSTLDTFSLSQTEHILRWLLNLALTFLVVAYLHLATQKDLQQLQAAGITTKSASLLPVVGISLVAAFSFGFFNSYVERRQIRSFQQHVYCELLQPGMTMEEVSSALLAVGPHAQLDFGDDPPPTAISSFAYFRVIYFEDFDIDLKYQLYLGLGYDKNKRLMWIARSASPAADFKTVTCP